MLDPTLAAAFTATLTSFIANLASEGVGALARRPRFVESQEQLVSSISILAELEDWGVKDATKDRLASFLQTDAFTSLAETAYAISVSGPQVPGNNTLSRKVRAYLGFYASIPSADLNSCSQALSRQLATAAKRVSIKSRAQFQPNAEYFLANLAFERLGWVSSKIDPERAVQIIENYSSSIEADVATMSLAHLAPDDPIPFDRLYVTPRFSVQDGGATPASVSLDDLFSRSKRVVVKGDPGAGKSTLIRHLVRALLSMRAEGAPLPLHIEVRRYFQESRGKDGSIVSYIVQELARNYQMGADPEIIEYLLHEGRCAVFFDGLDEVLTAGDRIKARDAIGNFARLYPHAPIVVTSRIVGYKDAPLEEGLFRHVVVSNFNNDEVSLYAHGWFANADRSTPEGIARATTFLEESAKYAADLRANPLMLSLLCATYWSVGSIPKTRVELYEKCAELMFYTWDRLRNIDPAEVAVFRGNAKSAIYSTARWVMENERLQSGIPEGDLVRFLTTVFQDSSLDVVLAREEAQRLVAAWRGRAWIIADVGTSLNGGALYKFTHQTFLEYFAAVGIVRFCADPNALADSLEPRILASEWAVVIDLAVAVLGTFRDRGADDFVLRLLSRSQPPRDSSPVLEFIVRNARLLELRGETQAAILARLFEFYVDCCVFPPNPGDYFERAASVGVLASQLQGLGNTPELIDFTADDSRRPLHSGSDRNGLANIAIGLLLDFLRHTTSSPRIQMRAIDIVSAAPETGDAQQRRVLGMLGAIASLSEGAHGLAEPGRAAAKLTQFQEALDRTFRVDWRMAMLASAIGRIEVGDPEAAAPPWQIAFVGGPPIVPLCSGEIFSPLAAWERDADLLAVGAAFLEDVGRSGSEAWTPVPASWVDWLAGGWSAGMLNSLFETPLIQGPVGGGRDILYDVGRFLVLAISAEQGGYRPADLWTLKWVETLEPDFDFAQEMLLWWSGEVPRSAIEAWRAMPERTRGTKPDVQLAQRRELLLSSLPEALSNALTGWVGRSWRFSDFPTSQPEAPGQHLSS